MSYDIVRDTAVNVLLRVLDEGAYLDIAVDKALRRRDLSDRGRRFMTQLAYGTVRHRLLCDHVLGRLLEQPLEDLPGAIRAILRMGVFQALFCDNVTFPSMVHTSVDLAKHRGHAGTARLVNAVLRRVPERLDDVKWPSREKSLAKYLSVRYSTPPWLVEEWLLEYGEAQTEALCDGSCREAVPTLRVNTLKTTPEDLIERLDKSGATVEHSTPVPEVILWLDGPPPVRSKHFLSGHYMLQDAAAMLAAHLLEPREGETVLDLCAAPGGKTTHLAQLSNDRAHVVAMDLHFAKLRLVRDNTTRLGVTGVSLVCGDGLEAPFGACFDRVLVDAPCTGLGTLRRHPDLKWRVSPEERTRLAQLQQALLRSGLRLCKNGGLVVYSVCTFSRQETREVVGAVMETENVELEDGPEWLDTWKIAQGQYQTLPGKEAWDGFFLTRLRKRS